MKVAVDQLDDPAPAQDGAAAGAGERLVSLELMVRAEQPRGAETGGTVALAFKQSAFPLVAADDSLYIPAAVAADLAAAAQKAGTSRDTRYGLSLMGVNTPAGTVSTSQPAL